MVPTSFFIKQLLAMVTFDSVMTAGIWIRNAPVLNQNNLTLPRSHWV